MVRREGNEKVERVQQAKQRNNSALCAEDGVLEPAYIITNISEQPEAKREGDGPKRFS